MSDPTVSLFATLAATPTAFPRFVATCHRRGWALHAVSLVTRGGRVEVAVRLAGCDDPRFARDVVARLVDVHEVVAERCCGLPDAVALGSVRALRPVTPL